MSLNYLATRFTCSWPWNTLVMLCDGRMVCGCADPYGNRPLGDARTESVSAIWTGERIAALRRDLNEGGSKFCGDCALKLPLRKGEAPPQRDLAVPPQPARLYIECTAACNISCAQACCAPETGITRTRQAGMLDFELFRRVVDEAGPSLERIEFFNYGEAFLHKRAIEMCEYIKARFPNVYLYTSTNGLAFNEDQVRRLVHSGIDEITFSVDGATQESYAKYRQRGDFAKAIRNMRAAADEKRTAGRDLPFLNWRYILFTHNDSDEEMDLARRIAADTGIDRLCWELTDHPEDMFSRRFVAGTADYERIANEVWDRTGLGNAIPGATPHARIELKPGLLRLPGLPVVARRGRSITLRTTVENASKRTFPAKTPHGRRLIRLGAQLCTRDGAVIDRDYERAWLPHDVQPGTAVDVPITVRVPARPGRYAIKFDLVCEGIDWFESHGSPVTIAPLVVL